MSNNQLQIACVFENMVMQRDVPLRRGKGTEGRQLLCRSDQQVQAVVENGQERSLNHTDHNSDNPLTMRIAPVRGNHPR